jgi:hypothetical protein
MRTARVPIVAVVIATAPLRSFAQSSPIQRGSIQIGGSAAISHAKNESSGGPPTTTTTIQLTPQVGYFVARGVEIAANLQYVHYSGDQSGMQWGVGPSFTYYPFTRAPRASPCRGSHAVHLGELRRQRHGYSRADQRDRADVDRSGGRALHGGAARRSVR